MHFSPIEHFPIRTAWIHLSNKDDAKNLAQTIEWTINVREISKLGIIQVRSRHKPSTFDEFKNARIATIYNRIFPSGLA